MSNRSVFDPPQETAVRPDAPTPDAPSPDPATYADRDAAELLDGGRRRVRRTLIVFAGIVLLVGGVVGAGGVWLNRQINPSGPLGPEVTVEVPPGSTTASIGTQLADLDVVTDATIFRYYARYKGVSDWQAGLYTFRENSPMGEVIAILDVGPAIPEAPSVTIPEGFSVWASAGFPAPGPLITRLADPERGIARFEQEVLTEFLLTGGLRSRFQPPDVVNVEGLLFPDTYEVDDDETEADVLTRMVSQFDSVAVELGYDDATARIAEATGAEVNLTPYQAIIVASLIERETKVPEERAMVARVIYNRLAAGEPLGIDATTAYALGRPPVTQSDVEIDSPYNTRFQPGLPPTPIGLPGRAALEAALAPAPGDWFFYVLADEDGRHFFTSDAGEFEEAKAQCQAAGLC